MLNHQVLLARRFLCLPTVELAMKTEPLFDRTEINRTIQSAKANRVRFLLRRESSTGGLVSRLGAIATACLTFFAGRWHFFDGS
jgi:hypothetical protein